MQSTNLNRFGGASQLTDPDSDLYSQYGNQRGGRYELVGNLGRLGQYQFGPAASRAAFNANNEGDYQTYVRDLIQRLRNRNYGVLGDRAANRFQSAFGTQQGIADQQMRSMGLGEGARLGASQGLSSLAARGAAAAQQSILDPQRRDQDLQSALQLLSQSLGQNPYLDQMQSLAGPELQAAQANGGRSGNSGIGGTLGSLLGSLAAGGAFNRIFK